MIQASEVKRRDQSAVADDGFLSFAWDEANAFNLKEVFSQWRSVRTGLAEMHLIGGGVREYDQVTTLDRFVKMEWSRANEIIFGALTSHETARHRIAFLVGVLSIIVLVSDVHRLAPPARGGRHSTLFAGAVRRSVFSEYLVWYADHVEMVVVNVDDL